MICICFQYGKNQFEAKFKSDGRYLLHFTWERPIYSSNVQE